SLIQSEVTDLQMLPDGWELVTRAGAVHQCKAVILATGTFLGGKIFVGELSYESGPDGMFPATFLTASLRKLGISLRRFKTGTPARVNRRSIDFSELEEQ
ncbi:MAG: FAD-dependent oxidoreductase, partial [Oscillospiraceae bacterium]